MSFLFLFLLLLTSLQADWPEPPPWLGLAGGVTLTWIGVVLLSGVAACVALHFRRRLAGNPLERSAWLRRLGAWRRYHFFALLSYFLVALYLFGWGAAVKPAVLVPVGDQGGFATMSHDWPGAELCLLAPFFAGLILSWCCFYEADRAAHVTQLDADAFPTRWSYVGLQARYHFLLVVPPLVLLVVQQILLYLWPSLKNPEVSVPFLAGLLAFAFLSVPFVLRVFLGLRPLPPGPLRDRLEICAKRLRFRFSNILIWDTRGAVANAMVTGFVRFARYVVLTDRLTRDLSHEEIEAVFGHEVGHVKHHHMFFYIAFMLMSMLIMSALWEFSGTYVKDSGLQDWAATTLSMDLEDWQNLAALPIMGVVAAYIFVVFGFLSRRCERQADIYGCRTVSTEAFISALEKVADVNGISRERPGWLSSWQHGTIAERVAFLRTMNADPRVEPRFQRHVGVVKWAVTGTLFVLVLIALFSGLELFHHL